jgi:hypothetical protein
LLALSAPNTLPLHAMTTDTRTLVETHWRTANARDWAQFRPLLHPELRYEVPQTREFIESAEGYFEMFRTWPGNWQANTKHLVCEGGKAICIIVFETSGGLICKVTDYWPAPYEPPTRETAHLKRRPE